MYEIFRKLLASKGLSVADVSKATGISQSTLSNWKKRNNMISMGNAEKIADFLGVSVDYLMGRERPEAPDGYYLDAESANIARAINDNPDLRALFDNVRGIGNEDLKIMNDMAKRLRETNPDG